LIRVAIHTVLRQYLSGGAGRLQLEAVVTLRRRVGAFVRDQAEAHDLRDALAYVLLADLSEYGERLLCCAASRCGRLFVRERRQRYCSVSCRNRTSFQRWYRRHRKAGAPPTRVVVKKSRAARAAPRT
jgi:predicted RNA-binding Zn ribbon-like protein